MTSLSNHQSTHFVKLLLLGDAKAGKTGSLASLVEAGYLLRILDLDNLLDFLKDRIAALCPTRLSTVEFRSIRDRYKAGPLGPGIDGKPKAWSQILAMCDNWKYDDIDLGKPAEWGDNAILVIDSLSRLCDAVYNFHEAIIPRGRSGDYDSRAVYGNAQDDVEKFLAMLTSPGMATNVIVICHGTYQSLPDGTTKIFPQGIGQKLSPKIPQYFPNYVRYRNVGGKRTIQLDSDPMIDLSNGRPSILTGSLPIDTGLSQIFAALREHPAEKPKSLSLKRIG